jgi:hypothetical protein
MIFFSYLTDFGYFKRLSCKEEGTAYPSWPSGFTPSFWWGLCCSSFEFMCCVFCFVCTILCLVCPMLPVSLDCPFLITPQCLFISSEKEYHVSCRTWSEKVKNELLERGEGYFNYFPSIFNYFIFSNQNHLIPFQLLLHS